MIDFFLHKKLDTAEGELKLEVAIKIEPGKFISLYGASGAGKTSILRMLAGLMKPDKGFIKMNDNVWFDDKKKINVEPQKRKIGFVFQDYALFPNMNVKENIAFALQKNSSSNLVDELLEITGLSNFYLRKTQTLSGGQQQRCALARAIATKPNLLLLDEPLSAIDNEMRAQLQTILLEVHQRFKLTTILVSHDINEIMRLADIVVHVENGKVKEHTTPAEFFIRKSSSNNLTGNIVSMQGEGTERNAVILFENRMMEVKTSGQNTELNIGDTVEFINSDKGFQIRKL